VYLHVIGTRRPQQSERAIFCTVPIGTLLSFANELRVIAGRLYIAHRDRQPNYFWTCHYRAGVKLHVRTGERSKWSWRPMEASCDPENIEAALRAVVRNKGAPGVHGITARQLPGVLHARWPETED
jgi:hypothetical protein